MISTRHTKDVTPGLRKQAQGPSFTPSPAYHSSLYSLFPKTRSMGENMQKQWGPGGKGYSWNQLQSGRIVKGMAKGVRNFVPGIIDLTVGSGAGLLNGLGHLLSGGSFSEGYDMSSDFVRKYMSDPIRRAEMAVGGNAVKKVLDKAEKYHMDQVSKDLGPMFVNGGLSPEWKDFVEGKERLDNIENATSYGTEFAMGGPVIGKMFRAGKLGRGLLAAGGAGPGGRYLSSEYDTYKKGRGNVEALEKELGRKKIEHERKRMQESNQRQSGAGSTAFNWEKALAGGGIGAVSGALLGKLFGGNKLAKWLALAGMALGGVHGSGVLDGIWKK